MFVMGSRLDGGAVVEVNFEAFSRLLRGRDRISKVAEVTQVLESVARLADTTRSTGPKVMQTLDLEQVGVIWRDQRSLEAQTVL